MFRLIVHKFLSQPGFKGTLTLTEGDKTYTFGQPAAAGEDLPAAKADIQVLNPDFYRRAALFGQAGFGQAYFLKDYDTSDLKTLLLWFLQNAHMIPGFGSNKASSNMINMAAGWLQLMHRLRRNTRIGSRKNIRAHYDLSNDFYSLWLDPTMTYSSAVFTDETGDDLKAAQEQKYRRLCEMSQLGPNDHVLEIGCGWGGFAEFAAKNYGCRLTVTTISDAQHEYAAARFEREGLTDQVTLLKQDYRDLEGQYDKIVSIEMMEALGHEYVPLFLERCHELLAPGGTLCFQCITFPDENYEEYHRTSDYVREYIFPGGELLALGHVTESAAAIGLVAEQVEHIGLSYARTLNHWHRNFMAALDQVRALGFDEEFIRKWVYYLISCEAAFELGYINDAQVLMRKASRP
jgi:cyclopropane-fatty-acyl-phospholipid synthase